MPIYEFECTVCHHVEERSDLPITSSIDTIECSSCKGLSKKVISKSSFNLKGSGWYADGYSPGSGKSAKK